MSNALVRLAGIGLLAYGAICGFMYLTQDSLMYRPTPESHYAEADALRLSHEGETLKIWKSGNGHSALIYFGGNAEDVGRNIARFNDAFVGTTLYLVNYRGYGGSTGMPDEETLYRDAAFVFDYVAGRHATVTVMGRSLGSGIAVRLADQRPVAKLVLITPYDSIERLAADAYPFIPVSLLIRDRYPSVKWAPEIEQPVLILAAKYDRVIPNERTLALIDAFDAAPLTVHVIDGVSHSSISHSPHYLPLIAQFLQQRETTNAMSTGEARL